MLFVKLNELPSPSVNVSIKLSPVKVTFPLFSTLITYVILSPKSLIPLEFTSLTLAVLVTSIIGFNVIDTFVESSVVFPSASFPLSEVSVTLLLNPGLEATTLALLIKLPESTSDCCIM